MAAPALNRAGRQARIVELIRDQAVHSQAGFVTEISAFFASYQTLMPQVRFLDSMKRDKYGPRGF